MGQRLQLQQALSLLLGSNNVYFQPPATLQMSYPCFVYARDSAKTDFANNSPYRTTKRYSVTYIDKDPDSDVPDKLALWPMCVLSRHFKADNLNHDVYNLYF